MTNSHSQEAKSSGSSQQKADSINSDVPSESDVPLEVRVERANQLLAA